MPRKLALVVGHDRKAPGARALNPISNFEYFYNSSLAGMAAEAARTRDVELRVFYRDGVGISGAYAMVAKWAPDACIELHFNSCDRPEVQGTETLCNKETDSVRFASFLQRGMCAALSRPATQDRGVKILGIADRGGHNVTALSGIPCALVEPFFGSSTKDAILGNERRRVLAESLIDSFNNFFGQTKGET